MNERPDTGFHAVNWVGFFPARKLGCLAVALGMAWGSQPVHAVEANTPVVKGEVTLGGYWSDNILQTTVGKQSGEVLQLGAQFFVKEDTRLMKLDVDVNAAYERYLGSEFKSGIVGGLRGSADFSIVPDKLSWRLEENFSQGRISPFEPSTPTNRQNINYLRTGPDFKLRLGDRDYAMFSARYTNVAYEVSLLDSERMEGGVSLVHRMSDEQAVSVHARNESSRYSQLGPSVDADYREGFLRYELQGRRTQLTLDGGYTQVALSAGGNSGALARGSLDREISASLRLALRGSWQVTDAANLFRENLNLTKLGLEVQSTVNTAETVEQRRASGELIFSGRRTSADLIIESSTEDYQLTNTLDRSLTRVDVSLRHALGPSYTLFANGRYTRERYVNTSDAVRDKQAGIGIQWAAGRSVGIRGIYELRDRSGQGPVIVANEQRVMLTAFWQPWVR